MRSPIRWVGGKSRIRDEIISVMPDHKCYVEVFSGAAWILFEKEPSNVEILNDKHNELVNFFEVIKDSPEDLIKSFEWEVCSRHKFESLKEMNVESLNKVERAHRFFYLIMASWGAEIENPRFQTSVSDRGNGNRLINAVKKIRDRVKPIHERLRNVIIENLDWQECIRKYDKEGVLMYLDPPYPENSCNYKHDMKGWDVHEEIANKVRSADSKMVISYKDSEKIRDMYEDLKIRGVNFQSGMPNHGSRTNEELIITNF